MNNKLAQLIRGEEGIQHAEEALLLALIAVAAATIVTGLGTKIGSVFTAADGKMVVS